MSSFGLRGYVRSTTLLPAICVVDVIVSNLSPKPEISLRGPSKHFPAPSAVPAKATDGRRGEEHPHSHADTPGGSEHQYGMALANVYRAEQKKRVERVERDPCRGQTQPFPPPSPGTEVRLNNTYPHGQTPSSPPPLPLPPAGGRGGEGRGGEGGAAAPPLLCIYLCGRSPGGGEAPGRPGGCSGIHVQLWS